MRTKSNSSVLAQADTRWHSFSDHNSSSYSEKQFKSEYKEGRVLGKGVWGVVSDVCTKKKKTGKKTCFALKRIQVQRTIDFQTADMDTQYLDFLKKTFLHRYRIVPCVTGMWISGPNQNTYNLLMSKYDGNMHYLSVDAHPHHLNAPHLKQEWKEFLRQWKRPQGLYYRSELLRMYAIAWLIGTKGVVHGDLKPDQYLFNYPNNREQNQAVKDIALTDFGFAGLVSDVRRPLNARNRMVLERVHRHRQQKNIHHTSYKLFGLPEMGWPSNEKSPNVWGVCRSGLMDLTTRKDAAIMNLSQLEAFLISDGEDIPTAVIDDRKPLRDQKILIFTGIHSFLSILKSTRAVQCWYPGEFFNTYKHCQKVWERESETLSFTLEDIRRAASSKF